MDKISSRFTPIRITALLMLAGFWAGQAAATILPPPGFNPDDGAELFTPAQTVVAVELFDLGQLAPPTGGYEFGFYFASDPSTQITIFDSNDDSTLGSGVATINFATGLIIDVDQGGLQGVFATSSDPIGFYLTYASNNFFTQSALNGSSGDVAATFAQGTDPANYVIGFETVTAQQLNFTLALEFVGGITPFRPVAEPATALLMAAGLLMFGASRRRRGR